MGPKYWGTVRKCKNCLLSGPRDLTATPAFKAPWRRREAAVAASYGQQSTCNTYPFWFKLQHLDVLLRP
jgi:hypothetical protein